MLRDERYALLALFRKSSTYLFEANRLLNQKPLNFPPSPDFSLEVLKLTELLPEIATSTIDPAVMAASVDEKLLRQTKFPPEFNQKVDMQKVNVEVMKK
jgi:hypothetical protein